MIRRGHELRRGAREGEEGVAEVGVRSCYATGRNRTPNSTRWLISDIDTRIRVR